MVKKRVWTIAGRPVPVAVFREFIIGRDGPCVLLRIEPGHVCRNNFGQEGTAPTLEHVVGVHHRVLDGRKDDERHVVSLCEALNGGSMKLATHEQKVKMRDWLVERYPHCAG